jgi:hypothetical protein
MADIISPVDASRTQVDQAMSKRRMRAKIVLHILG